jgi:hypothetical protein
LVHGKSVFTHNGIRNWQCRRKQSERTNAFADYEHIKAYLRKTFLISTDIHPHPGQVQVHLSNITSANTPTQALGEDTADLHFVSEASLADHEINEVRTFLRDSFKKEAKFTGTDRESGHRTGGVGAIASAPHRLLDIKPLTAELEELDSTGRVALYCVEAADGHTIACVIIYGWTGGAQSAKDAARTNDLIRIVFRELQAQPDGPQ